MISEHEPTPESVPFKPYAASETDMELINTAIEEATRRLESMWDFLEEEDIKSWLVEESRASTFYTENYPDHDIHIDSDLIESVRSNKPFWVVNLDRYGSDEAKNRPDVLFRARYPDTAGNVIDFCSGHNMNMRDADKYLGAAINFTEKLFDLRFISHDGLLEDPMHELGLVLGEVLDIEDIDRFEADWSGYLKVTLAKNRLLGTDGTVWEYATALLVSWVQDRVVTYMNTPGTFERESQSLIENEENIESS